MGDEIGLVISRTSTMRTDITRPSGLVAEIRLHRTADLDHQRIAVAILGGAGRHPDPAFADAIFLDIGLLDALEANPDVARQHLFVVIGTPRIGRQTIGKLGDHFIILGHSSASISLVSDSGLVVGACRATTRPRRSTRNLVKFHLIDAPNTPGLLLFRYRYSGCALSPLTSI